MSLRQILNVAYAHLTRDLPQAKRGDIDRDLAEKFDYEMTDAERARVEYRRAAAELGVDLGQQQHLMDAFTLRPVAG